jgi:hypothetical protein
MSYDMRKRADRERQERKRLRDEHDRLASSRAIDQALVSALRDALRERHSGLVGQAWRAGSEIGEVVERALRELERLGYDVEHPTQTARVLHRLGDASRDYDLNRGPSDAL